MEKKSRNRSRYIEAIKYCLITIIKGRGNIEEFIQLINYSIQFVINITGLLHLAQFSKEAGRKRISIINYCYRAIN